VWELAATATALRTRLGRTGACPPELAEAAAALQGLACALAPDSAAAAERLSQLWQLQSGLPAVVQAAHNGPYLVSNVPTMVDYLGAAEKPTPQLALCRCGASAIKPLCDGSHARIGFTDGKDPSRVPDRRDSYQGQQLTILDNRGICQHSGLCTDRLATVFRTGAEPFVAPSGGRMDEIIRAVRDCPSGALSYAIDGTAARDQVDWGETRRPAIEVTKDGPYRITGRVSLLGADGKPAERAEGSSLEHYALCRCGYSKNKPFCSGMHWYVSFQDPVTAAGHEPTLYEWAGGLPALTRMARLLYEKHVPDDVLLAPAFAEIPADQPQRLARWLAEALGGPAEGSPDADLPASAPGSGQPADGWPSGGPASAGAAIGLTAWQAGDEQQARWVGLMTRAANEAGLPADPGFRAAFSSCTEWTARAVGTDEMPPRWDWGPAGPPEARPRRLMPRPSRRMSNCPHPARQSASRPISSRYSGTETASQ
jgi:CDGSH-type Zn-finger protein/truncated hemoglobin YjbI